jgi:hexosaminidase
MVRVIFISIILMLVGKPVYNQSFPSLMPMPTKIEQKDGKFFFGPELKISYAGRVKGSRVKPHVHRFLKFLNDRTGMFILKNSHETEENGNFSFSVIRKGKLIPGEDEGYSLNVDFRGIVIEATTDLGVIHALQTLRQLLSSNDKGYYFPFVSIIDRPRFTWRGMLLDVCRHFIPIEVVKRNILGMNFLKMNVFHWHLTEDQGFRIESKKYPKLHQLGSDGSFYTQGEIREVIQFADSFGIRVVPEFDMPGHTTSWFVGYPELASRPGPYEIATRFGVQNAAMDPTNSRVYTFLDTFLTEMAGLFPDPYIHIGGDEVNGKVWDAEPHIREYKYMNGLQSNELLQAFFNRKLYTILTKNNKKMVGWDEILQPELGEGQILIQSWRGRKAMYEAAGKGYQSILSQGYYIDLCQPSRYHYTKDPIPIDTTVSKSVAGNILGGEATMWSEIVDEHTVDSRIWPRTAAIAERLWSPVQILDVRDMYFRLMDISSSLEDFGLRHNHYQDELLEGLVKEGDPSSIKFLVDYIQPIQGYARHSSRIYTTTTALNRIPDAAVPDPLEARKFYYDVKDLVKNRDEGSYNNVESRLESIRSSFRKFLNLKSHSGSWQEEKLIFQNLDEAAKIGLEVIAASKEAKTHAPEWKDERKEIIRILNQPSSECELAIYDGIYELIDQLY